MKKKDNMNAGFCSHPYLWCAGLESVFGCHMQFIIFIEEKNKNCVNYKQFVLILNYPRFIAIRFQPEICINTLTNEYPLVDGIEFVNDELI